MKPRTNLTTLTAVVLPTNGHDPFQSNHDNPAIAGFLAARESLEQRRRELEAELAHIQRLFLGENNDPVPLKTITPQPVSPPPPAAGRSNRGLGQAVADVLAAGPLTKEQIIERLLARKFEFFGKPKPALDAVLYSKKIRREGKLFSLAAP